MENSKLKDKRKKEKMNGALKFVKEHIRYFAAGALFLVLVLVLVTCAKPKDRSGGEGIENTEAVAVEEPYEVDAHEKVNLLIEQYYTAYAEGDVDMLNMIASPISANEQSYISLFSQYVDEYKNIKCYTKSGLDANSYLVSVSMEIKFAGVETTAPGLDFFYLRTNEQGFLYVDNLYSQYNLANQENALDTSVQSLIYEFENDADVIELQSQVQARYDAAVASDESLATMIQTTIPEAIAEWVTLVNAQNTQEAQAEQPTQETEAPQTDAESETPEQTDESAQTAEKLATTDRVNVRSEASTDSDKLGTVEAGTVVTRTGVEGEWSIIDYDGQTGYIKNEYLTYDTSSEQESVDDEQSENADSDESTDEEDVVNISEGTEIKLEDTVNIRSGMSETSDKVGTAYKGEKVTVVMSYAEGWTKVEWNGETGYIKSSLLQ